MIKIKILLPYGVGIVIGPYKRFFWRPLWTFWPARAAHWVRGLFPKFYARGVHCCDHGGHIRTWYPAMALCDWHFLQVSHDDIGDGPDKWQQIPAWRWIHWRIKLWRADKYSENVDDAPL